MRFLSKYPFVTSLFALAAKVWVLVASVAVSIGLVVWIAANLFGFTAVDEYYHVGGTESGTHRLLSLKVSGVMVGDSDDGFVEDYNITSGYLIKQQLYKAAEDPSIKGVILEIDSPGGTINGAMAIAEGVAYYREQTKRPIFAHIGGVGASGGYWAAVAADRVTADRGSEIGSIGVIMGPFKYYDKAVGDELGVFTANGIESKYVVAGKSKDAGDPYRRLTQEEQDTFQKIVNNEYSRFVTFVSQRRGISEETIRNQLGAFAYDSKSALDFKLIDEENGREETYAALAVAAGVAGDYEVIRPIVIDEGTAPASWQGRMWPASTQVRATDSVASEACSLHGRSLAYSGDPLAICKR